MTAYKHKIIALINKFEEEEAAPSAPARALTTLRWFAKKLGLPDR